MDSPYLYYLRFIVYLKICVHLVYNLHRSGKKIREMIRDQPNTWKLYNL